MLSPALAKIVFASAAFSLAIFTNLPSNVIEHFYKLKYSFSEEVNIEHKVTKFLNENNDVYYHAAVASSQLECSIVGKDILKAGGNAVDAAIASTLCEGVVEPYHSGIGGGAIMVIYNHTTKSTTTILSREKAPSAATSDMFVGIENPKRGAKLIAVPGQLRGLEYAYKKYGGKISWTSLFQPAIDKAKNGFTVSGELAIMLETLYKDVVAWELDSLFCDIYCNEDKTGMKQEGDTVKNPLLAETLTKIQQYGVDVFYNGEIADQIIDEILGQGGIITKKDLLDYDVIENPSIKIPLPNAGYTMHASPLPMGGPVLGAILSVMDLFGITPQDYQSNATIQWQRTIESFRHAYGARYSMGDPIFASQAQIIEDKIVSGDFAKETISKIFSDRTFHDPAYYGAKFMKPTESSTSHLSVLDQNKNAVAITSTIAYAWGSYVISPSTGVIFNDNMADFSFPTGDPAHDSELYAENQIEGGKRPLSSMTPAILLDNNQQPVFVIGGAGGLRIPTSVAQVLLRLLYFGSDEDITSAIKEKRLHDSLIPDYMEYEGGFVPGVVEKLRKIGHNIKTMIAKPRVNGIQITKSQINAYSDLRDKGAGASGW
ncbi:glutathione hydrolase 1 proenzyme-like isoform X1 [Styela clava]